MTITVTSGAGYLKQTVTASRRHPCDHSESRSSSGPLAAHGPLAGPAAGGAEIGMRRRVGPLRVAQLLRPARGPRFPKGPAAGGAEMCMRRRVASAARGPGWVHCRQCRFVQRRAAPAWTARGPRSQLGPRPVWPKVA